MKKVDHMKSVIKSFIISVIFYMFIGVLLGGMLSIGKIGVYSETEAGHWLEVEHIFINNVGFLSFIIIGLVYFVTPLISKKEIYSKDLAKFDFFILNFGL